MTPGTLSSGLVPQPPSSTHFVPPTRNDWDTLLQLLFDKCFHPPPCVDHHVPEVAALKPTILTGTPSSTPVDQDAPSPSTSQTPRESPSHVIPLDVEEADDIKVAHMDNHPFVDILISEPSFEESSSQVVTPNNVHSITQPPDNISKWTKDHPIDNVICDPSRPIEAMQEELNEFECLEVWELVPRLDRVMIITLKWIYKIKLGVLPKGIFLNQSKYALESLKKYGMETYEPVDTPMVNKSKLDEDPQEKAVDLTRYHGMIGILMYLTSSRPDLVFVVCMCARYQDSCIALTAFADADHAGCQDTRRSVSGSMQLLGDRLVCWSSKKQKIIAISSTEA
uniref:Reverse transcriptase Ty1/copia-type domain-containing protein n=1 Tax=Tanacetum cinerariifolium TaxID=118510 RepID=A0A6L2NIW4_TANCI|nr:hypothetical protein [Tanacetum cinerariifolium]